MGSGSRGPVDVAVFVIDVVAVCLCLVGHYCRGCRTENSGITTRVSMFPANGDFSLGYWIKMEWWLKRVADGIHDA